MLAWVEEDLRREATSTMSGGASLTRFFLEGRRSLTQAMAKANTVEEEEEEDDEDEDEEELAPAPAPALELELELEPALAAPVEAIEGCVDAHLVRADDCMPSPVDRNAVRKMRAPSQPWLRACTAPPTSTGAPGWKADRR